MNKVARRRIEANTPYAPPPPRTFADALEAIDDAVDDLRLVQLAVEVAPVDRTIRNVLFRSTQIVADALAQLQREKAGAR